MNGKHYTHQNAELFALIAWHFRLNPFSIDKLDRAWRTVTLCNGTVLSIPDDWDLS